MNTYRCRECKNEISPEAKKCPYCGATNPIKTNPEGSGFEWKSSQTFYGYPLVHIVFGRDENNKIKIAKGIIAIGRSAVGLITFGQFSFAYLIAFGQVAFGPVAIGQLAVSLLFGAGQLSVGYIAIGQISLGFYAICQVGLAKHILTPKIKDPETIEFFRQLLYRIKQFLT